MWNGRRKNNRVVQRYCNPQRATWQWNTFKLSQLVHMNRFAVLSSICAAQHISVSCDSTFFLSNAKILHKDAITLLLKKQFLSRAPSLWMNGKLGQDLPEWLTKYFTAYFCSSTDRKTVTLLQRFDRNDSQTELPLSARRYCQSDVPDRKNMFPCNFSVITNQNTPKASEPLLFLPVCERAIKFYLSATGFLRLFTFFFSCSSVFFSFFFLSYFK